MKNILASKLLFIYISLIGSFTVSDATGQNGMVVSSKHEANKVGIDILKAGGNAIDAAVGVAFALSVTHPSAGNIGGGGFMIIRLADGTTTSVDFSFNSWFVSFISSYFDRLFSLKGKFGFY